MESVKNQVKSFFQNNDKEVSFSVLLGIHLLGTASAGTFAIVISHWIF